MKRFIVIASLLSTILAGCAKSIRWDVTLTEVERPKVAKERYGTPKILSVNEQGVAKYSFEDDLLSSVWYVDSQNINFSLINKTDHSIKILWDEAAFVDQNGTSHRVMHAGVKYNEKEKSMPPSVIVRKGRISDIVKPVDNVRWMDLGKYSYWQEDPILPVMYFSGTEAERSVVVSHIGQTVQVLLPLQIEGITNEYVFTFKVSDAFAGDESLGKNLAK